MLLTTKVNWIPSPGDIGEYLASLGYRSTAKHDDWVLYYLADSTIMVLQDTTIPDYEEHIRSVIGIIADAEGRIDEMTVWEEIAQRYYFTGGAESHGDA